MKLFQAVLLGAASAAVVAGQGTVIHDKTGACQMTLAPGWKPVQGLEWSADAPGNAGNVQLVSQAGKSVRVLTAADQKALLVDKVISNTPQRVFYSNEAPKTANPLVSYRAVAPGKGGICVAMFAVRAAVTEDTLKKMVESLKVSQ
jgi:hypothetical protein